MDAVRDAATAAKMTARVRTRAARQGRARARLLRFQAAAIRPRLGGATVPTAVYESVVADVVMATRILVELRSGADSEGPYLRAAATAHRIFLSRYARLGPSLPN